MKRLFVCLFFAAAISTPAHAEGVWRNIGIGCLRMMLGDLKAGARQIWNAGRPTSDAEAQRLLEIAMRNGEVPADNPDGVALPLRRQTPDDTVVRGRVVNPNPVKVAEHAAHLRERIAAVAADPALAVNDPSLKKFEGLVLPQPGVKRKPHEVERLMKFVHAELSRPDITTEQFFAVLDVAFSTDKFQISQVVEFANIKSIKFIGEGNVLTKLLLPSWGKASATVKTESEKTPGTHVRLYGNIPTDPEEMAIWVSSVVNTLHEAASERLGQQAVDHARLTGRQVSNLTIKPMEYREGTRDIYRELQNFLNLKFEERRRAEMPPPPEPEPGALDAGTRDPTVDRYRDSPLQIPLGSMNGYTGLIPNMFYHAKAVAHSLLKTKLLERVPFSDLIIEPLKVSNPLHLRPTREELDADATPEQVAKIERTMRQRMISFYTNELIKKYGPRVVFAMTTTAFVAAVVALGFQLKGYDKTIEKSKEETAKTTEVANRQVNTLPTTDLPSVRTIQALEEEQKELIRLNEIETNDEIKKSRNRRIQEITEQVSQKEVKQKEIRDGQFTE